VTLTARQALQSSMQEDELLSAVVDALRWRGYLVHHDRRSDKALQQGDAGFPDICATKRTSENTARLLFLELKAEDGRLTGGQQLWLTRLQDAGADVRVLRPSGLDGFLEELK
jgi:hypothetical protein